jgi:uncharacterized protein YbaP (TraB family)
MVFRLLFLFLLSFSFVTNVFAQAENSSVLYEVSGGSLKQKSYVFGTIHLRDRRVFEQVHDKKDSFWICFRQCDIIAGELRFDKKEMKNAAMNQMMMDNGVTLRSLMTKEDYTKVKVYAKRVLGWKAIVIDRIKPLFTISLLTESMVKADCKWPLDIYLQHEAQKRKKEIVGIETVEEQLKALSSMSLQEQVKELINFVNAPSDGKKEMEQMIKLYQQRHLLDLYQVIAASEMSDSMETAFITDRNQIMADRIEAMMMRKPVFAAIGSAHLPGDKGVLRLLQDRGYKVRAIQ